MNRPTLYVLGGAIVLAALVFLSHAFAQRDFRTGARPMPSPGGPFPRYQVVTVNESEIILLDSTTGDLYSAKPRDVKPYAARPRPGTFGTEKIGPPASEDKDVAKDFAKDKDKDRFLDFKDKKEK
jgi:hypothetical protein